MSGNRGIGSIVCLDVNHAMARADESPAITAALLPRLKSLHLADDDGVDELEKLTPACRRRANRRP